ncbi:hypothetical protein NMS42_002167 [Vibrio cholerae]|nr:hypothetical protein [Vibrio cholerae]
MNIEHIDNDGLKITFTYELIVEGHYEILRIYEELDKLECNSFPFNRAAKYVLSFLKYKPNLIEIVFLNGNTLSFTPDDIELHSSVDESSSFISPILECSNVKSSIFRYDL